MSIIRSSTTAVAAASGLSLERGGSSAVGRGLAVAIRSNEYVFGRSIAGTAGSKPAEGIFVRLLCLLCVV